MPMGSPTAAYTMVLQKPGRNQRAIASVHSAHAITTPSTTFLECTKYFGSVLGFGGGFFCSPAGGLFSGAPDPPGGGFVASPMLPAMPRCPVDTSDSQLWALTCGHGRGADMSDRLHVGLNVM